MLNECIDQLNDLLKPGKEFAVADAKAIVDHVYNNRDIDTDSRFHNIFFHEICPLLLMAEHIGHTATHLVFLGADSRFDGLILLNKQQKQKVELTAAIDGYQDALRMELLAKRGYAPAFQKIQASGTRKNRTFGANQADGWCADEYDRDTLLPLLEKALTLKVEKAKTNRFYSGAWLGVVFDDWVCPMGKIEKQERFDPLCRRLLDDGPARYAPFARVFIIGISRQYVFDSCAV